jgi:heavy metal sensor kinase
MRAGVDAVLDEELRARFVGVQRFMERYDPRVSLERMQDEFREHAGLRPGGDLLQVSDERGQWLFRSTSIGAYEIDTPGPNAGAPRFETLDANGGRLRVLSAAFTVSGRVYTAQLAAPVAEAYDILRRFQWVLLTSIPLVLVVASLGGYWMSRRALAPVDAITQAAQSVGEHNLSSRLAIPPAADELQRLTVTFNQMLGRLETSFKRITQFTADASHELRTPVALVRTTAEVSLRRDRDNPEYRDALDQILDEAKRMTGIIDSLMTLARVDSGAEVLRSENVDVALLVRDACTRSELLTQAKQIHLETDLPGPVVVHGDAAMLQRLFLSLIDNAIKYTPPSGRVQVSMRTEAADLVVTVQDTGIGISKEDLPFIYDRFYRADKVRSREVGSAGLGLSIARWIAEAHRGSVRAESALGEGSVFEVRIPRAEVG